MNMQIQPDGFSEIEALWAAMPGAAPAAAAAIPASAPAAPSLLSGLNAEQLQAVSTTEGPLLVVAGAGTGKTRVLTTRIAHIVDQGLAFPQEILAVTFTNKAASEMRERIVHLIGDRGRHVRMGSFHAISLVMLRHHPRAAGLQNDRFMILDDTDQRHIVEDVAKDLGFAPDDEPAGGRTRMDKDWKAYVRQHQDRFMSWKEEGWTVADAAARIDAADPEMVRTLDLYRAYQDALAARNAVDFADLILHMVRLFREDEAIRRFWADKYKYILVDEFQDTNPLQYAWLEALARDHRNLCVVGDDDQSIYQWRNARPELLIDFASNWPGAQVITVDRNYRSTQEILDVANAVVAKNPRVGAKRLKSPNSGDKVSFEMHNDHLEEARSVAQTISWLEGRGHPLSEIAILFRSAGQMRVFEEQLIRQHVPYTVVGGMKFHEREEVKDALAYLRLAVDPRDEIAFLRIANKPARNIGESTAMKVVETFRTGLQDLGVACRHTAANGARITQAARMELENLAELIDEFAGMARDGEAPGKLLMHMLERVAYISWRVQSGDEKAEEREESLGELVRDADTYQDIASYLQALALLSAADVTGSDDAVRLSTIHASKGLEWDTVFTPCLEEGVLPNVRALQESYGLAEERRIAHVGWTRPRKKLYVSCSRSRYYQPAAPSHFLFDAGLLDPTLYEAPAKAPQRPGITRMAPSGASKFRRRRF